MCPQKIYHFLKTVGFFSTSYICIWDLQLEEPTLIRKTVGYKQNTADLHFTSCGNYLIQSLSKSGIVVYETLSYTSTHLSTASECSNFCSNFRLERSLMFSIKKDAFQRIFFFQIKLGNSFGGETPMTDVINSPPIKLPSSQIDESNEKIGRF